MIQQLDVAIIFHLQKSPFFPLKNNSASFTSSSLSSAKSGWGAGGFMSPPPWWIYSSFVERCWGSKRTEVQNLIHYRCFIAPGSSVHIAIKQMKHLLVAAKALRTTPCACLGCQQKKQKSWMKIQQRYKNPKKDLFGEQFQVLIRYSSTRTYHFMIHSWLSLEAFRPCHMHHRRTIPSVTFAAGHHFKCVHPP